ncbi:MAG TPA: CapA family protein [Tenericutes bacterium]|nr:CapA family protein [Mycoplasmatota bacterium]
MKKTFKILLLFGSILFVVSCINKRVVEKKYVPSTDNQNSEHKLSLIMVGDALIHGAIYKDAYINNDQYDFSEMFENIRPYVKNYDLAFYNQETIIGGKDLGLSTYPLFNSPEEIGDELVDVGFNMVSLANNHTLDKGEKAILHSLDYWNSKDVIYSGCSYSFEDRNNIETHSVNDIEIAFLSYTIFTNGLKVPNGKEYLVNIYSENQVKKDIEQVKDKVDIIIVSMHWGEEYNHEPNKNQKQIAEYLSSLGVNIIIGHHPHVIQPIEYINDTLVIYSLGNFISAQVGIEKLIGAMVSLEIKKVNYKGHVSVNISNVDTKLLYTYYKNFKDFKVIPFDILDDNILMGYKELESDYTSIIKKYDSTIKVNGS